MLRTTPPDWPGTSNRRIAALCLLAAAWLPARAQSLSPQELFRRVSPSVVVVEVNDFSRKGAARLIASGSGVVVPSREKDANAVVTNCHVVDKAPHGIVGLTAGETGGVGWVTGRDATRDLCIVHALFYDTDTKGVPRTTNNGKTASRKLPAVQVGSSQWLEIGDPVYAVGAPQGLEQSLSSGLVSGIREYEGNEYIQTTAPISKGSSGGGLFDAQGRLVGITTMYVKDGQALNFAVPAELIASIPAQGTGDTGSAGAPRETPPSVTNAADGDSRWMYVTENTDGGVIFLDRKTTTRSGSDVTVWWKTTYRSPQKDKAGDTFDESAYLDIFHCGARKTSALSMVQRLRGKVVYSHDLKSYEVERTPIRPDTIGEAMYEAACSL